MRSCNDIRREPPSGPSPGNWAPPAARSRVCCFVCKPNVTAQSRLCPGHSHARASSIRLSRAGNWLARHLTQALEALVRVENWLHTPNERELRQSDRAIVQPLLARVGDQAKVVAELVLGPDLKQTA